MFSNLFGVQWGNSDNIPFMGGLTITLPNAYTSKNYTICGTVNIIIANAGDGRLMICSRNETQFDIDWSNGGYNDPIAWLTVGY